MSTRMRAFWTVFLVCGFLSLSLASDKRILLNDNDVYDQIQEIKSLKAQFLAFQTKIASLENTVTTLRSTATAQTRKITSLELKVQTQEQINSKFINQSSRAVFTRWGRSGCPSNDTELVYSGMTGGGLYNHYGSAANYVCLPHDPYHFSGLSTNSGVRARMYGAEYQDSVYGGFYDKDVPCAVCLAKHASSVLMIPGKNSCHAEWKLEYSGILSAGAYDHQAASEYVCVDRHPEALEGGFENANGKLVYPVYAECGSLRCPPYRNGEILSCAVCSK